jgi:hypothetical protein
MCNLICRLDRSTGTEQNNYDICCWQSAFIKGRYIQDNFRYVQASARLLHARRHLSLLLNVDISRAFDFVCWLFLLDVMSFVGFLAAWREWIAVLFSSASTRIQWNGVQGDRICHT